MHSFYAQCSSHSLDLILSEAAHEMSLVADTLNFVQGVSSVITESSKRKQLYQSFFGVDEVAVNILGLCLTRWCIRDMSIKRVTAAYPTLLTTLHELKDDKCFREDSRAKIGGLNKQALKRRTYFSLLCCQALFEPCEVVATSLQSATARCTGMHRCAERTNARYHHP